VYHLLPVSLDCPFVIAPSVFSNVYKKKYLPVSLDCPFLLATSVFSNVYLVLLFGLLSPNGFEIFGFRIF
jgi:hypothetical protein